MLNADRILETNRVRRLDRWRRSRAILLRAETPAAERALAERLGRAWSRAPVRSPGARRIAFERQLDVFVRDLESQLEHFSDQLRVAPDDGEGPGSDMPVVWSPPSRALTEIEALWLLDVIRSDGVLILFQPAFDISTGERIGYDGTIQARLIDGTPKFAAEMFRASANLGIPGDDFARFVCVRVLEAASHLSAESRLFLNVNPQTLSEASGLSFLNDSVIRFRLSPDRIVIALDHMETVSATGHLRHVLSSAAELGMTSALDDFAGDPYTLRNYANLGPRWVKLDERILWTFGRKQDGADWIRRMVQAAKTCGAQLIVKGVESAADLDILAMAGATGAQGPFLAQRGPRPLEASPDYRAWFSARSRRRAEDALRATEKRYQALFERNLAGVYRATRDGRIVECNDAFARVLGYSSRQEVLAAGQLFPYFRIDELKALWARLQRQRSLGSFEACLRRRDGKSVWVLQTVGLLESEEGTDPLLEGILMDITERKRVEQELKESRQQLRDLFAHLQLAREQERQEIAREIHDELGQALTGLTLDLSWLRGRLSGNQEDLVAKTKSMSDIVHTTLQAVRRISTELRPALLDDLGLLAAAEWQVHEFRDRTGVMASFRRAGEEFVLDSNRSTALFRILQEALTNVARHARAKNVWVELSCTEGILRLEVRDNGRGISRRQLSDPKAIGLTGMRERALAFGGKVTVESLTGEGTRVVASMPLQSVSPAEVTLDSRPDR